MVQRRLSVGAHSYTARAVDTQGLSGLSNPIAITGLEPSMQNVNLVFGGDSLGTEEFAPGWHQKVVDRVQAGMLAANWMGTLLHTTAEDEAVSGSTIDIGTNQMAGRISQYHGAYQPGCINVLLCVGEPYNQVRDPNAGVSAQQAADSLNTFFGNLLAVNSDWHICPLIGFDDKWWNHTPRANFPALQAQIISILRAKKTAGIANFGFIGVIDPAYDQRESTSPLQTTEGVHFNAYGAEAGHINERAAAVILQELLGTPQPAPYPLPADTVNPNYLPGFSSFTFNGATTVDSNGALTSPNGSTPFGNLSIATKKLVGDGFVSFGVTSDSGASVLGLALVKQLTPYTQMQVGVMIGQGGTNYVDNKQFALATTVLPQPGTFYGIRRIGSKLTLMGRGYSSDWVPIVEYNFASTDDLYIFLDQDVTGKLVYPQGQNLVAA